MPHLSSRRRKSVAARALPIALLACVGLTACGGSSASTTTSTAANAAATSSQAKGAATTSTTPTTPAGASTGTTPAGKPGATPPGASRFAAVRECLQKNGVTLPQRPAGGGPGGFRGADGGAQLPKGMTHAQYQAVLAKCGGGFRGPGASGSRRALNSPRFRQALASFAACLRQNGVDIPAPNTSGKGPIFGTKGIDVRSPQFKKAEIKCRGALLGGLRTQGGAASGGTSTTG